MKMPASLVMPQTERYTLFLKIEQKTGGLLMKNINKIYFISTFLIITIILIVSCWLTFYPSTAHAQATICIPDSFCTWERRNDIAGYANNYFNALYAMQNGLTGACMWVANGTQFHWGVYTGFVPAGANLPNILEIRCQEPETGLFSLATDPEWFRACP